MIIEIVSFQMPTGFSNEDLLSDARSVAEHWQSNPDLIRKHFVRNSEGDVAGIYIWPNKEAALKAHNSEWIDRFRSRTGTDPNFAYWDMFMLIDNETDEVREFPLAL